MPCFHPITAYRSIQPNPSGKYSLSFNYKAGYIDLPITVPCGQCIGCRIDRAREWSVRCMHEAKMHEKNCFVTLTYDDEHLPAKGSLDKDIFRKFMYRLRKEYGEGIRFFQCGEYGTKLGRPHHHIIFFGFDFPDKEVIKRGKRYNLYIANSLSRLWPFGYHIIGDCNNQTVFYTARYCLKKVTGKAAESHYAGKVPEYITMSLRPALGREFYEKYKTDLYPLDKAVVDAKHIYKVPKYYDKLLEIDNPKLLESIKQKRIAKGKEYYKDITHKRMMDKEKYLHVIVERKARSYENSD